MMDEAPSRVFDSATDCKGPVATDCKGPVQVASETMLGGEDGEMDLLRSESGESSMPGDAERQRANGAVESAMAGTQNNLQIQPDQPALSFGSDGNCCVLKSSNFSGKLRFEGAARIECRVAGEIHGTGVITVAESAVVTGPIRAASILIAGRVNADVTASERIEIRPSARVAGNLIAPTMIVHENAQVEGRFIMAPVRS
jgi:cytoskeletal protein CcmA (bactofilin family)